MANKCRRLHPFAVKVCQYLLDLTGGDGVRVLIPEGSQPAIDSGLIVPFPSAACLYRLEIFQRHITKRDGFGLLEVLPLSLFSLAPSIQCLGLALRVTAFPFFAPIHI